MTACAELGGLRDVFDAAQAVVVLIAFPLETAELVPAMHVSL